MENRKNKLVRIICTVAAIVFVLTVVRGYIIAGRQVRCTCTETNTKLASVMSGLNDDWAFHRRGGNTVQVNLPTEIDTDGAAVTVSKNVPGVFRNGQVIKFDNLRQGVTVYADGEVIYEVNTTSLTKQLRYTDYVLVGLPDAKNIKVLTMTFTPADTDTVILPEVSYGAYSCVVNDIVCGEMFSLIMLSILALFLLFTTITYVFLKVRNQSYQPIFDIAVFLLATVLWGLSDSYLPTLTRIPQEVLGIVNYLSIMALPVPICHFVWINCKKEHKVLLILTIIGAINLIAQAVLSCFGIVQLNVTFYSAHALIIAVIVASLRCIYKMRSTHPDRDVEIMYSGLVVLAAVAAVSLFLYWLKGGIYYRSCMLTGVMVFTVILCGYVIVHYMRIMQEDRIKLSESLMHERLSMFDPLTGLPNRRAFEKEIGDIEDNMDTLKDVVLVMLDLNGLKLANDKYGHSAGDDLIVSAANAIKNTYGEYGSCFRIGGDEFVAIMKDLPVSLTSLDDRLEENIAKANAGAQWKLSIAKGVSHLLDGEGNHLTISDWKQEADVNMYRDKVATSGNRSLERSQNLLDIISCIVSTVEAKDKYTAVHSDRVRELSCCIARKMGASELTMQNLSVAAQLHDIGKIGVPDNILLKKGRLTADEYEKIKLHSQIGASIIRRDQGMKEVSNIVLHHHERWDGRGYPDGLSHKDIPMESRIIAVADSIDAMTSKRIYRDSMPLDDCRREIEKNAGIMYDPAIVQIALQNWEEIVNIVLMHPKHIV